MDNTVILSDCPATSTAFKSKPKPTVATSSCEIQTDDIRMKNRRLETNPSQDAEVQTSELIRPFSLAEDTSEGLSMFLGKAMPLLEAALVENEDHHDFDGWDVLWEESKTSVSCLHTLSNASLPVAKQTNESEDEVVGSVTRSCTAVSWNSTGQVIGVAYGRHDHSNWCTHRGAVGTWNILRSLDPNKPDVTIETPTCVTCLQFHPEKPSILATGTFSGDIQIWDIRREDDPLIGGSKASEESHREPVTRVTWVADRLQLSRAHFNLVSTGADGKLLGWSDANNYQDPTVKYGLCGPSVGTPDGGLIGATAISFNRLDPGLCISGAEHGGIFQCAVRLPTKMKKKKEKDLRSPITMKFGGSPGPVHDVSCNHHSRNLFAACGADSLLRIFTILQTKPVHVIDCPSLSYLFAVDWSYSRPSVCAVSSGDGHVHIFDLLASKMAPILSLDAAGRVVTMETGDDESDDDEDKNKATVSVNTSAMYGLAFNPVNSDLLASCSAGGQVRVWQLSSDLARAKPRERDQLENLFDH